MKKHTRVQKKLEIIIWLEMKHVIMFIKEIAIKEELFFQKH